VKYLGIDAPEIGYDGKESEFMAIAEELRIWSRDALQTERYYVGGSRSFPFHRPGSPFARRIGSNNFLIFKTRRNAFLEGFSPCKRCEP
jgi:micrococcal nuclease